jgi:catechol 2,3-dioxygenase-like lactoylglutathione lyase family enzyme
VRLNQVTLAVSDLARSVDFYRRLGLEQIVADAGYARFE